MDPEPDPGGPKTSGSGSGSGSATLQVNIRVKVEFPSVARWIRFGNKIPLTGTLEVRTLGGRRGGHAVERGRARLLRADAGMLSRPHARLVSRRSRGRSGRRGLGRASIAFCIRRNNSSLLNYISTVDICSVKKNWNHGQHKMLWTERKSAFCIFNNVQNK